MQFRDLSTISKEAIGPILDPVTRLLEEHFVVTHSVHEWILNQLYCLVFNSNGVKVGIELFTSHFSVYIISLHLKYVDMYYWV